MISVVIPTFNGEQHLDEVLAAVTGQVIDEPFEVLVIDSGSTDRTLEIVSSHPGVKLIEIPNEQFGHGRTRNLGVQQTSGELIAFLTQDATPASENWLAAYRDAFAQIENLGAAFGPHLPRDGVNPLMARLLIDHFAKFGGPGGPPAIQQHGDSPYLSNSNSCISRAAWLATPFLDIAYTEDHAFGVDVLANGFSKAYVADAGAFHSHEMTLIESFRRHFDDYRGLNETTGERTEASASHALNVIRESVQADRSFLKELGQPAWRRAAWTARSGLYHTGRVGFGGLGARAARLPGPVQALMSLDGREGVETTEASAGQSSAFAPIAEVERSGAVPLVEGAGAAGPLHVAWVIPAFSAGGGGHTTIFRMVRALEEAGHRCSIWVHDPARRDRSSEAAMRTRLREHFFPLSAPVYKGFDKWRGADVVVATGWETVYQVLRLQNCVSRAYFAQDHEAEFFATSAPSIFAAGSYRHGLFCICFSEWLAEIVREQYGAEAVWFDLGVDPDEYRPLGMPRRRDTIAVYARHSTERRAVELSMLALEEVKRQRPDTRVVLYGAKQPPPASFELRNLGVVSRERLCRLYNEATVGLALSLTSYSLIPQEMMACGLPVVELACRSCQMHYGEDGDILAMAEANSMEIAARIIELLDDPELHARRSARGIEFVAEQTWERACEIVVDALVGHHARAVEDSHGWVAGSLI
jgi:GT2 family glycosyltransferase/glycosyltransferase involved in cell wall biosynthesis